MRYLLALAIAVAVTGCRDRNHDIRKSSSQKNAESVYLTHDNHNDPVVVWTEKTDNGVDLLFAVSPDDGKTFGPDVLISLPQDVATHAEGMPKLAFKSDGTIIVAYERKVPTKENKYAGVICFITSADNGKRWSEEKYIHRDTLPGRSRSYFDLETLPDGEVGAAWLDIKLNPETGGRSVVFARTDHTNTFNHEILIDSSACQCCRLEVYTDVNKNVFVAYRGLKKGTMGKSIRDMMVVSSTDRGKTFTAPVTISSDNWNIDGCPHTGPSLCSNKAGLFTLWYTEGNGNGIYYAHKSNTDDDFLPRELVSNAGRHPQVSSNGNHIAMLWEENIDNAGKSITTVNYKLIKDGTGIERKVLTPTDANAFLPVVTQIKGGFLVAFLMEDAEGRVGAYLRRL